MERRETAWPTSAPTSSTPWATPGGRSALGPRTDLQPEARGERADPEPAALAPAAAAPEAVVVERLAAQVARPEAVRRVAQVVRVAAPLARQVVRVAAPLARQVARPGREPEDPRAPPTPRRGPGTTVDAAVAPRRRAGARSCWRLSHSVPPSRCDADELVGRDAVESSNDYGSDQTPANRVAIAAARRRFSARASYGT
jgi:hypothetical protein